MNKLICIAVLCFLSFQSHAKEEIWSDEDNNIFVQSADIKVLKQGIGIKALRYSKKKYGDKEGFIKACLGKCTSKNAGGVKKACGGIVVMYSDKKKKTPKKCAFKKQEAKSKDDKAKKWEFYKSICYAGGPYRFSTPKGKGSCKQFGLKKVGKGKNAVVAGDTNEDDSNNDIQCTDGDPYTAENDAACQAAGKKACWKRNLSFDGGHCKCGGFWENYRCEKTAEECGSPWVAGQYDTSWIHPNYDFKPSEIESCFRAMAISDTGYGARHYNNSKWRNLSCTFKNARPKISGYFFDPVHCDTSIYCSNVETDYSSIPRGDPRPPNGGGYYGFYPDNGECPCSTATLRMSEIPFWGGWDEWEYRAKPWNMIVTARCK